jgi:hypothetical protein
VTADHHAPADAGGFKVFKYKDLAFFYSRKENPSVPIANRASSPIMGAFLSNGVVW